HAQPQPFRLELREGVGAKRVALDPTFAIRDFHQTLLHQPRAHAARAKALGIKNVLQRHAAAIKPWPTRRRSPRATPGPPASWSAQNAQPPRPGGSAGISRNSRKCLSA